MLDDKAMHAYYMDAWRLYLRSVLDFHKLEQHVQQMTAYARDLHEQDADGYIRVWAHAFEVPFDLLTPDEEPLHRTLSTQLMRTLNTHHDKKSRGSYYIGAHAVDGSMLGIFYKEPSGAR